jgi:hypothetical protein
MRYAPGGFGRNFLRCSAQKASDLLLLEGGNEQRVGVHDDGPLKGNVFLEQREWAYRIRRRVSDRA